MDSGHLSATGTHRSRDGSTCAFLTTGSKQSSHRGAISHQGKQKVVIGDNLSSHLSPVSLKRAEELGVHFRLLPPNTTHFLQPLDVAFFGPLKRAWRDQLLTYKRIHLNKSLLKRHFAGELKKLVATIKQDTVISGFKATGLVPFDPEAAIARMPASVSWVFDPSDSSIPYPAWSRPVFSVTARLSQVCFQLPI